MDQLRYLPVEGLALGLAFAVVIAAALALPAVRRRDWAGAQRVSARVLLVGAMLAVLGVTLTRAGAEGANWVPGAGIQDALDNANRELGLINLVGNMLLFVPIGCLMPLAGRLTFMQGLIGCAVFSSCIEVAQLLSARSLDVDDVILNTLGGACGALMGVTLAAMADRIGRLRRVRSPA